VGLWEYTSSRNGGECSAFRDQIDGKEYDANDAGQSENADKHALTVRPESGVRAAHRCGTLEDRVGRDY
jgi:hypothetical protein